MFDALMPSAFCLQVTSVLYAVGQCFLLGATCFAPTSTFSSGRPFASTFWIYLFLAPTFWIYLLLLPFRLPTGTSCCAQDPVTTMYIKRFQLPCLSALILTVQSDSSDSVFIGVLLGLKATKGGTISAIWLTNVITLGLGLFQPLYHPIDSILLSQQKPR